MAIEDAQRTSLAPGTRLAANYKGTRFVCVVGQNEAGERTYTLEHSKEVFNSPSRAGSEVMNGTACNGWRFWTLESELNGRKPKEKAEKPAKAPKEPKAKPVKAPTAKAVITKPRNQKGAPEGQSRYMCSECGEPFSAVTRPGTAVPDECPQGHLSYTDAEGNVQTSGSASAATAAAEPDEPEEDEDEFSDEDEDEEEDEE